MTTSAALRTSTKEVRHADRAYDGEASRHAASRYGRRPENPAAGCGGGRTRFPRTSRPAGGSAVDVARESGAWAAHESSQTPGHSLRGRDRLPDFARSG